MVSILGIAILVLDRYAAGSIRCNWVLAPLRVREALSMQPTSHPERRLNMKDETTLKWLNDPLAYWGYSGIWYMTPFSGALGLSGAEPLPMHCSRPPGAQPDLWPEAR